MHAINWFLWHSDLSKFNFGWGFTPDPAEEAYEALLDPLVVVEVRWKILKSLNSKVTEEGILCLKSVECDPVGDLSLVRVSALDSFQSLQY